MRLPGSGSRRPCEISLRTRMPIFCWRRSLSNLEMRQALLTSWGAPSSWVRRAPSPRTSARVLTWLWDGMGRSWSTSTALSCRYRNRRARSIAATLCVDCSATRRLWPHIGRRWRLIRVRRKRAPAWRRPMRRRGNSKPRSRNLTQRLLNSLISLSDGCCVAAYSRAGRGAAQGSGSRPRPADSSPARETTRHPPITDTYGWILLQKGRTAQALPLLRTAAASGNPLMVAHYTEAQKRAAATTVERR